MVFVGSRMQFLPHTAAGPPAVHRLVLCHMAANAKKTKVLAQIQNPSCFPCVLDWSLTRFNLTRFNDLCKTAAIIEYRTL